MRSNPVANLPPALPQHFCEEDPEAKLLRDKRRGNFSGERHWPLLKRNLTTHIALQSLE